MESVTGKGFEQLGRSRSVVTTLKVKTYLRENIYLAEYNFIVKREGSLNEKETTKVQGFP